MQGQQFVIGVEPQYTNGADAAFTIAAVEVIFMHDVVGQAAQVIELSIAVGFLQWAGIEIDSVFFAVLAAGLVGAGGFLRQAAIQAAQVAEAQDPLIHCGLAFVTHLGIFQHLGLEAFDQGAAVEAVPFGDQGDAVVALWAASLAIPADAHCRPLGALQTGNGVDATKLQLFEQQFGQCAVIADGAQQFERLFRFGLLVRLFDTAHQHVAFGSGQWRVDLDVRDPGFFVLLAVHVTQDLRVGRPDDFQHGVVFLRALRLHFLRLAYFA
ncbi:hypothetical protein D9M71_138180 [compost metagenome]